MKIIRFCFGLILVMAITVQAQSDAYKEWIRRRDALKQDGRVVRYYTFEDVKDSKSPVADLSSNGKHLTFVPYRDPVSKESFDDLHVIEGRWPEKRAVRLDRGYYQGATVPIENRQFTAEVWFRRQGSGSLTGGGLKNGTILAVSGYTQGWRIVNTYEQAITLRFCIGQKQGCASVYTKTALPDNIWTHLAVTWDGSYMKIYINGKLVEQQTEIIADRKRINVDKFEGDYIGTTIPFKIGYSEHGVGSIKMDVDEVVIYNKVLSAEEIGELGKGPAGVSEKDVFSMADAFIKAKDYRSARVEYEKLKNLPSYGRELALFNIAESFRMEKDYAGAHRIYDELLQIPNLAVFYSADALFRQADIYMEQKKYDMARQAYGRIKNIKGVSENHLFNAALKICDTYRAERNYSVARGMYERMLVEQENCAFPHDGYRLEIKDRLALIEGLHNGEIEKKRQHKLSEWLNRPVKSIYVSRKGKDSNAGTENSPFATIKRAQEEVRKIKESGMPEGGITVYIRGGKYFLSDSVSFDSKDSGNEDAPVVYRSYQGEDVTLAGGRQITNFRPLSDPDVQRKLPEESRKQIWVSDLKELGITDYGQLLNRGGFGKSNPAALELFCNGRPMQLSRWPNKGYVRISGFLNPDGFDSNHRKNFKSGSFMYSDNRPERWVDENDAWLHGYWYHEYDKDHVKVAAIDTKTKVISVLPDIRWYEGYPPYRVRMLDNQPYYAYNLLSEIDSPGEWYLDRDTGKLYFYPPENVQESEVIVSTLDAPIARMDDASNIALFGLTLECTRRHAVEINKGNNNLIAACTIRNTGQWAVMITGGWNHKVVGCDMYDMGEGGVSVDGGDRKKLIPSGHLVDNNHILRFNRFDGGYRQAVQINGSGNRISHNVISEGPMQAIYLNANDNVIEYNELYDAPYEGREIGAIYIYGEPWYLMSRGNVIRNNFFHHISYHSSPNLTQGLCAIHIDAVNAGLVIEKNVFYRFPAGISSTYPGNRLENNIFIDAETISISQGDRSRLFHLKGDVDADPNYSHISRFAHQLKSVNYKQPPWNSRYPQLVSLMVNNPLDWPKGRGSIIERNINTGGRFISFSSGSRETTVFQNNREEEDLLFVDSGKMDFSIRPGAPVYGLIGCEPVKMEDIGVYKDELRASWPIKKEPARYYKTDWQKSSETAATLTPVKRVSKALEYNIHKREKPVMIDGKLDREEWMGLDKKKAMVIEQYYTGEKKEGPASYAWMLYDNEYLYLAMEHEADPWKEGMPQSIREKFTNTVEIVFEGQTGPHSHVWWREDMVTGPLYIFWAFPDGKFEVKNNFGMPHKALLKLETSTKYAVNMSDSSQLTWVLEMRIPLADIGINPSEAEKLCFNIGINKRPGWFAWVATGSSVWRVENAGYIKFSK